MTTRKVRAACIVLAVAALIVSLVWFASSGGVDATSALPHESSSASSDETLDPTLESIRTDRVELHATETERLPRADAETDFAADTDVIRGVVETLEGARQPFADVSFRFDLPRDPENPHAPPLQPLHTTCDAEGRFTLPVPERDGRLDASGERFVTILAPFVRAPADLQLIHRVVVVAAVPIIGLVTDENSVSLNDALVEIHLPDVLFSKNVVADRTIGVEASTRTDADGRFEFPAFPLIEGVELRAFARGFRPSACRGPTNAGEDVQLVLSRLPPGDVVCGIVVDANRKPTSGAAVSVGAMVVRSKSDGVFCMDLDEPWARQLSRTDPILIMAIRGNMRSKRVTLPSFEAGLVEAWPTPLVLVLDVPRLELGGRVVDADGTPLHGIVVGIQDVTWFGFEELQPGSGLARREALEAAAGSVATTTTDRAGEFRLSGLDAREYTLEALDPRSLAFVRTEPVPAGSTGVEIRFAPAVTTITGRVLDPVGAPIPNVKMALTRESQLRGLLIGNSTFTDTDGRFRLSPASGAETLLRIEGDTIMPQLRYPLPSDRYEDAIIVLARRCHVRVDWSTVDERADRVNVYDASGVQFEPMVWRGAQVSLAPSIFRPSEDLHCVPQTAAYAVTMSADGIELQRTPVVCDPGATQVLEF